MAEVTVAFSAAASLAPRLMDSAAASDRDGGYQAEAMRWLHAAGLCVAPVPFGGQGLDEDAQRLALLCVLKYIGRGDLVVGRLYEVHVKALQLIFAFGSPAQQGAAARAAADCLWFGVWNPQGDDRVRLSAAPSGGNGRLDGSKLCLGRRPHHPPLVTRRALAHLGR